MLGICVHANSIHLLSVIVLILNATYTLRLYIYVYNISYYVRKHKIYHDNIGTMHPGMVAIYRIYTYVNTVCVRIGT